MSTTVGLRLDSADRVGFALIAALAATALNGLANGQGGDTAETCTPIVAGTYTGTTLGFADDSDEYCPYSGSTSPDVYYCYTPAVDELLSLELCQSGYDTKVYVYDVNLDLVLLAPGFPACNDDACTSSGGGLFRSSLDCVPVSAGATYYVVVDGWGGDAGPYTLRVASQDPVRCAPGPCDLECPVGATVEPNDCDFGNPAPNDTINGGCNASPPSFVDVACGETICGTAYFDGMWRDTDWYRLAWSDYPSSMSFVLSGEAEFDAVVARIENGGGTLDCSMVVAFAELIIFEKCTPDSFETVRLDPGEYWFFVASDFSEVVDCTEPMGGPPDEVGSGYTFHVECNGNCPPSPWDLDSDGNIGFSDLIEILSFWGDCPPGGPCPWDFDGDLVIGFTDLLKLLSQWGPVPPCLP